MADQTANHSRILIVDDDEGTREALEVILEDDYEVTCVADGLVALDKLNREAFDLVLLDLIMPVDQKMKVGLNSVIFARVKEGTSNSRYRIRCGYSSLSVLTI